MTKLLIALLINVGIALFVIIETKRSRLPDSTKLLLYIIGVLMPVAGLLLFLFLNRDQR